MVSEPVRTKQLASFSFGLSFRCFLAVVTAPFLIVWCIFRTFRQRISAQRVFLTFGLLLFSRYKATPIGTKNRNGGQQQVARSAEQCTSLRKTPGAKRGKENTPHSDNMSYSSPSTRASTRSAGSKQKKKKGGKDCTASKEKGVRKTKGAGKKRKRKDDRSNTGKKRSEREGMPKRRQTKQKDKEKEKEKERERVSDSPGGTDKEQENDDMLTNLAPERATSSVGFPKRRRVSSDFTTTMTIQMEMDETMPLLSVLETIVNVFRQHMQPFCPVRVLLILSVTQSGVSIC